MTATAAQRDIWLPPLRLFAFGSGPHQRESPPAATGWMYGGNGASVPLVLLGATRSE